MKYNLDVSICLQTVGEIQADQPLTLTYSPTTTGEFFIHSGFIPTNMETDSSAIRITLPKGKNQTFLTTSYYRISYRKSRLEMGPHVPITYKKPIQSWKG